MLADDAVKSRKLLTKRAAEAIDSLDLSEGKLASVPRLSNVLSLGCSAVGPKLLLSSRNLRALRESRTYNRSV